MFLYTAYQALLNTPIVLQQQSAVTVDQNAVLLNIRSAKSNYGGHAQMPFSPALGNRGNEKVLMSRDLNWVATNHKSAYKLEIRQADWKQMRRTELFFNDLHY